MTKSYTQLMKQIAKLQNEAKDVRRKEVQGVIDRIKEAIQAYQLTAADLGLTATRGARAAKSGPVRKRRKAAKRKTSAAPKYRDEAGNTWVGRGKRPGWLHEALASGRKLEDFAIR
jgi:DNA-binding protein H-NS